MIKLVLNSKNKIIKLEKHNFEQLRQQIKHTFPEAPIDYVLSYIDSDKDEICLNSDEDLSVMLSAGLKVNKVYIKQSFSQTIDISYLTEEIKIQPNIEVYNSQIKSEAKVQIQQHHDFQKQWAKVQQIPKEQPQKIDAHVQNQIQKQIFDQPCVQILRVASCTNSDVDLLSDDDQKKEFGKILNKEQIYVNPYIEVEDTKKEQVKVEVNVEQKNEKERQGKNEAVVEFVADKQIKNTIEKHVEIQNVEAKLMKKDSELSLSKFFIDNEQRQLNIAYFQQKKKHIQAKIEQKKVQPKQIKPKIQFPFPKQYLQQLEVPLPKAKQEVPLPKVKQVELVYHNVICDSCQDEYGIIGIRYQCILCDNFNLCETCESKIDHPHSLLQIKKTNKCIMKEQIIQKYKKQIFAPVQRSHIPQGNYVPSISKQQANRLIQQAQTQVNQGFQRSKKYLDDLFAKLQNQNANPYQIHKGQPPVYETIDQKTKYVQSFIGGNYNQILNFCKMYATCTKQQILNIYMNIKNKKPSF